MKGLIILQRRFAPIANAIALELKNRHGVQEFCGFVQTRAAWDFTKKQKDVQYTDLILDEELHNRYKNEKIDLEFLREMEREYGTPSLWPCLDIDRTIMMDIPKKEYQISPTPKYSHDDMLRILQSKLRGITKFVEKEQPSFILGINVGSLGVMILQKVAKKKGIGFYTIETGKIDNRIGWSDDPLTVSSIKNIFEKIRKENYQSPEKEVAEQFLKNYRDNPAPPSFASEAKRRSPWEKIVSIPIKIIRGLSFTLKSFLTYVKNPHKEDTTTENPFYLLVNKMRRKIRGLRNISPLFDKVNLKEDFAYFPLHFEPEITTLLYSPFYVNQINLLTQIAKSLPVHFKLYVKEHPAMLEYRPTSYYHELKKIPNLKFISPKQSSLELIQNCKLVLTISGTAGFEASMLGKPVITFGDIFYNMFSSIKRCREIEELPRLIQEQLSHFQYSEREIVDLLSAVFEGTTAVDLSDAWANGDEKRLRELQEDKAFIKFVSSLAEMVGAKARR